jgi:hypothetical protein
MKTTRNLFATLFLLCIAGTITAQDVIVKNDQSTVMSKVLEITSTEIKYKKWNNQDGPTYSISRSEVLSINYENGEVEKFSDNATSQSNTFQDITQPPRKGIMECSGSRLLLNGRVLSDEEVRYLVGEHDYQLYMKGKNLNSAGTVLGSIGGIIAGAGLGAMLGLIGNTRAMGIAGIIGLGGIAIAIPGVALSSTGTNNLKQVAANYTYGTPYSLNLSPSMIRYETPQLQGNYGLGLTLSMNF